MGYDSLDLAASQVPVYQPTKQADTANTQAQAPQAQSFGAAPQDTFESKGIAVSQPQLKQPAPSPEQEIAETQEVGYVPEQKKGGLINLKTIAAALLLTTGAVATHKTVGLSKAFNAAKENGAIAKETEFKTIKTFFQNANPLNWTSNKEAIQKLTDSGYTAIDKTEQRIFKNGDDILILNGKKPLTSKFEAHESGTQIINEVKVAPEGEATEAAATTPAANKGKKQKTAKAASSTPIKVTEDEKVLLQKHKAATDGLKAIKEQLPLVAENSPEHQALLEQKNEILAYLKTPEMQATRKKQKAIKLQREAAAQQEATKAEASLTTKERVHRNSIQNQEALNASQIGGAPTKQNPLKNIESVQERYSSNDRSKENIAATYKQIQESIFGGQKIEKAKPSFLTRKSTANKVNESRLQQLTAMLEESKKQYESVADKTSFKATSLQDRMGAIEEVIKQIAA